MKESNKNIRILYLMQLPPPLHGVSYLNGAIYNSDVLNKLYRISLVRLDFAGTIRQLRKPHPLKILKAVKIFFNLLVKLIFFRPHLVYFTPMPVGVAFCRDLIFIGLIKLFPARLVCHLHNQGIAETVHKHPFRRHLYRFAFRHTAVIYPGQELINREILPLKAMGCTSYVVRNGAFIPSAERIPSSTPDGRKRMLFLAHITPGKGLHVLLDALREIRIRKASLTIELHIAGEFFPGKYENLIHTKIAEYGLTDVFFHGNVKEEQKIDLFRSCDLFVFPSLNDTLGLVVIEAMQAGLPCIVTDAGALTEYFCPGEECLLTRKGDRQELTEAILHLLSSDELSERIASAGREKALTYTPERFVHELRNTLERILSSQQF